LDDKVDPEPSIQQDEPSRFPTAFIAGLVVVFIVVCCAVAISRYAHSRETAAAAVKLPFGTAEQAYAPSIHFDNIQMARATNLLNQEFTYVGGAMTNGGSRSVAAMQINLEFRDPFNQVVLRDSELLITRTNAPLAAGDHRDFQITLEHIPVEWNQQTPVFRVTGLILQ
jgi:hypothetical protein